jgi:hypothetical protein
MELNRQMLDRAIIRRSPDVQLMAKRPRLIPILLALAAALVVAVPAATAARRDNAPQVLPALYVQYTMNCTFQIVDDFGHPVTTIPPGSYEVEVSTPIMFKLAVPGGPSDTAPNDYTGCKGWVQFQLTGPGVNLFTTLDLGCDAFYTLPATTFKAGASYTAQDLNQPGLTRTTIQVATSGTPIVPKTPYNPTTGKGIASQDIAGSEKASVKATVAGVVDAKGSPLLRLHGKPLTTVKTGRYTFSVNDLSAKAGMSLQAVGAKKVTALSAADFVGLHKTTVQLTPGRWMYYAKSGAGHFFVVTR